MNNPVLISTVAFDGYKLATAIEEIATMGADGVEVAFIEGYTDPFNEEDFNQTHANEILSHLKKHNIPCRSFSAHMDLTKDNGVEIFKKRMVFARMLGAETIVTNAAPLAKNEEFLANIDELGRAAKTIGINIGLENPGDGNANVIDTARMGGPVIDKIGLETVGLNYDFGNLISHCFGRVNPEEDYPTAFAQTNHYHIKDVIRAGKGWTFCTIGDGMINYAKILAAIAGDPRSLPVSLEIPLRLARAADASPVRADSKVDLDSIRATLKQSMTFVRKALTA